MAELWRSLGMLSSAHASHRSLTPVKGAPPTPGHDRVLGLLGPTLLVSHCGTPLPLTRLLLGVFSLGCQ